jgi:hypothetical protein
MMAINTGGTRNQSIAFPVIAVLLSAVGSPAAAQDTQSLGASPQFVQADPDSQVAPPHAEESAGDIAKKLQNPVADLISVPFQNNTNFDFGPMRGTQNILNVQPVVPFHLTPDWNLITRTILPLTWQPQLLPGGSSTFGLGNTSLSMFLSPKNPVGGIILGAGPAMILPTATSGRIGSNIWGAGPSAVALKMDGPWVYGALVSDVWSFGGRSRPVGSGNSYHNFLLQPFVNYNFSEGWYVNSAPILTANFLTKAGQQWIVPIGGGGGRVVKFGKLPVNFQLGAYYNAVRPSGLGPDWQLRGQVTFVFPQ